MKVLIAVDSFKGSLSSEKAGLAIAMGVKKVYPAAETKIIPMADGGEGTMEALVKAQNGEVITTPVHSPLGDMIEAQLGLLSDGTAVMEMAAASGLTLVLTEKRNPLITTTFGTGELIKKALDQGAKDIIIGIGGSATNDGGVGMAQALGVKFLDQNGKELPWGGGFLDRLDTIDMSKIDPRIASTNITVICDVDNPLCGYRGASVVYGPQKGATTEMIKLLDGNLAHLANVIKEQLGLDLIDTPGAGAAGGLGAGLMAFTGAQLRPGIDTVLDTVKIDQILPNYDMVITGEGRIDSQSLYGKVPMGVAIRAKKHGIATLAVVGSIGEGAESLYEHGLSSITSIVNGPISLEDALDKAFELTVDATERTFRLLRLGKNIGGLK